MAEAAEQRTLESFFGDKAVAATVEKPPEPTPEPKAEEKKVEVKSEEKPTPIVEAKSEEKPKTASEKEEKKEEAKPQPDWESQDNPYVKRHKDAGSWANAVNQENLALKRQLAETTHQFEVLNKKLDGTYDPAKDDTKPLAPEAIASSAMTVGRAASSLAMAHEVYGKEAVESQLQEFNDKFGNHPLVQARVLSSDRPVMEALKVLKEARLFEKYGADPDKMIEAIRKEVETELTPKLREEISKEIMARLQNKDQAPKTLTEIRDAGRPGADGGTYRPKSLSQILGS